MLRKIIKIDANLCNGCGLCVQACHEGAIELIEGKAVLLQDDYCDGLGDCLPVCPMDAISFETREADAYNQVGAPKPQVANLPCGCPGTLAKPIKPSQLTPTETTSNQAMPNQLRQWPVQIKLVPINAPYFNEAHLLIAVDCTAYAYGNFHNRFMQNKITLIGCPKLDEGDYAPKLTEIFRQNQIKSVTVVKMSVPCCNGIEQAVKTALQECGKLIQWQSVTITTDGNIQES